MLMYVGHMVSLALYVMVIMTALSCGWCLLNRPTRLYGFPVVVIVTFTVSLLLQASLFIGLQIDWIFEDFNQAVGDATAYAWLAFDYFNGFALLSFATILRIYLGWKEKKDDDSGINTGNLHTGW